MESTAPALCFFNHPCQRRYRMVDMVPGKPDILDMFPGKQRKLQVRI
jgi:hypothetical protein